MAYSGAAPAPNESYSIWVTPRPDSPLFKQLQGEIDRLAVLHGGPSFIPHVTVLGGMTLPKEDAVVVLKELAAKATVRLGVILCVCSLPACEQVWIQYVWSAAEVHGLLADLLCMPYPHSGQ